MESRKIYLITSEIFTRNSTTDCVDDGEEVVKICEEIEAMINVESFEDVMRVTPEEVKKATAKLKPGKGDP